MVMLVYGCEWKELREKQTETSSSSQVKSSEGMTISYLSVRLYVLLSLFFFFQKQQKRQLKN
jgi:hypothetical protein